MLKVTLLYILSKNVYIYWQEGIKTTPNSIYVVCSQNDFCRLKIKYRDQSAKIECPQSVLQTITGFNQNKVQIHRSLSRKKTSSEKYYPRSHYDDMISDYWYQPNLPNRDFLRSNRIRSAFEEHPDVLNFT